MMDRRLSTVFFIVLVGLGWLGSAVAQDSPRCAPGKLPMCLCACVTPDPRNCETLPAQMPASLAVRQHLVLYLATEAPASVQALAAPALSWPDPDVDSAFSSALVAARCFSGGQAGPANPAAVPAEQVKAWALAVLAGAPPPQRALASIVAALPAAAVRVAYLRAVELRRGLDYGTLGR